MTPSIVRPNGAISIVWNTSSLPGAEFPASNAALAASTPTDPYTTPFAR